MTRLPIDPVLPEVFAALRDRGLCVLQAPPGAGKTSRVPLDLLQRNLGAGRIVMLEPRRVAARAAAERLAEGLGSRVGEMVGYRMRGDTKTSPGARIEVVTEGILTRMIQSDPELSGIDCVIFDEFHERSLQADLGLALCLEIREALRGDLKLLVMSATLDAAPVAELLGDAPVVTSRGRSFDVETIWLDRPARPKNAREYALAVAALIERAAGETDGGILVFLPGVGEINRVAGLLDLPPEFRILPLHGRLPFAEQRAAIRPGGAGRKVVLATAIAETSLTLEDVRVVIDGGRARRSRFDPGSGMSRLVTERVTKAEAEQRRGRAGRVATGWCYRLWTRGEEGGLSPFAPPEISVADLAPLMLDLALWGASGPDQMRFLTPPPTAAIEEASELLKVLGALTGTGRITDHGQKLSRVPAHPRLAHMLVRGGGSKAVDLAALCENAGALTSGTSDLVEHLRAIQNRSGDDPPGFASVRDARARLRRHAGPDSGLSSGALLSLAYPDRIAMRRMGEAPRFLMTGGKGAYLDEGDPLARAKMLVVSDLDGDRREARIRRAIEADLQEIRDLHADRVTHEQVCHWDRRHRRVVAVERQRLGALVLEETPWRDASPEQSIEAALDGIRDLGLDGLEWSRSARLFQRRVAWLAKRGGGVPDLSETALLNGVEHWLAPWLGGMRTAADFRSINVLPALRAMLDHDQTQTLNRLAPEMLKAPTGTRLAIDYGAEQPTVTVRLQEMLGTRVHPTIGPDRHPVTFTLTSPAGRPIQVTSDLPNFWRTSYADVRKDMRGRYPRHSWPEDPEQAAPTRRTARKD